LQPRLAALGKFFAHNARHAILANPDQLREMIRGTRRTLL